MNAAVYRADTDGGLSYFIKVKRMVSQDISVDILDLLHKANVREIISPVKTLDHESGAQIDDFRIVLFPFVESQNGFNVPLTDGQWLRLGAAMRQIHDMIVPDDFQSRLRRESYSGKWREIVKSYYATSDHETKNDEAASKLKAFMRLKMPIIQHLVNRSEALAIALQQLTVKFVLCHSDIHAGNVLIDNCGEIYIVDWDDPVMAPKERDLMFIGGGVANVWNVPREQALFYQGYGETEINYLLLSYYRHERIVEDIAIYAQQILSSPDGGADRLQMYKHFTDMFTPDGVVDLAFKTDDISFQTKA